MKTTEVLLAKRPDGAIDASCFRVVETELPELRDGELLVKNLWLSLDPYMRRRMDARSYAPSVEVGARMIGGTVGEVVASKNPRFAVGARIVASLGWQTFGITDGTGVRAVDPRVPPSAHLGVVGMPGVTAWVGLYDLADPKPGETVVVSAAAGAVGSVVGQLAKLRGCRAVGIAGGPEKCAHVVRDLGFDACVDHRAPDFEAALAAATPDGIDVDFENVGGPVMDAVFRRLNLRARVSLCGLVSDYDAPEPYGVRAFGELLASRVRLQGFIVSDHAERWPEALDRLAAWVAAGELRYRETIVEGLENAPRALMGLLRGANLGKQLVKVA